MKKSELTMNITKWGVMAALLAVAMPEASFAQTISDVMGNVQSNEFTGIVNFASAVAYVVGAIFMFSGAISLKKHSENPATEPMNKGIGRLVAGGAIVSLPTLLEVMRESTHLSGDSAAYQQFNPGF